jgi:hypothetical protein
LGVDHNLLSRGSVLVPRGRSAASIAEWAGKPDISQWTRWTPLAYAADVSRRLITIAETPLFVRQAQYIWKEADREAFVDFIAGDPEAGDLIPETGGVRKVR